MNIKLTSIRSRIALRTGLCLLATIGIIVVYSTITTRSMSIDAAREKLISHAGEEGYRVRAQIEVALDTARTLANVLTSIKASGSPMSREQVNQMLKTVLDKNPDFLAVYTAWEPDAFDGMDNRYVNATGHDATGRFIPYWNHNEEGRLFIEPLVSYENGARDASGARAGDYYLLPRETKRECIIEPYIYPVQGKDTLMTSLVVPIVVNNNFYGIAGVDLSLEFLQRMADQNKTGRLFIFSNKGKIAAATNSPDLIGKRMEDAFAAESDERIQLIKESQEDARIGKTAVDVQEPILLGHTHTPWAIMIQTPEALVLGTASVLMREQILIGLAFTIAALWWVWITARAIVKPLTEVVQVAQLVATGNIAEARRMTTVMSIEKGQKPGPLDQPGSAAPKKSGSRHPDETGILFDSIVKMTDGLAGLVGQVQKSSVRLVSTVTEISATARQQETAMSEFGTSTTEVAAAVKEISATSHELSRTMEGVKEASAKTEALADTGRSGLTGMGDVMKHMAEATESISSKLGIINEKAAKINTVVTTITKVADQTNLLSLNAAIEAEKAGEHGLGFAVVSREIRRLADQTAIATLDITKMVQEMQASVATGVMEMDKFSGEVRKGVASVDEISQQMNQVIEQIEELTPQFEFVNEGMRVQSKGAEQIRDAMLNLSDSARRIAESLRQFNESTMELKGATQELQTEVTRFRV